MIKKKKKGPKATAKRKKKGGSLKKRPSKHSKKKKAPRKRKRAPAAPRPRRRAARLRLTTLERTRGLGPEAAGQAGDTEGISRAELADSESVEELLEEGQAFEAGIVSGVENAPDADKGGVRTRQVPEDDVPEEYLDKD